MPTAAPDAGLRSVDHYSQTLPRWRYLLRESLMPLVRSETPHLAALQQKVRSPALDVYFEYTANLGTHTFYMIMLPVLFWSGYIQIGRAMINVLAGGVFFSGIVKDLLCIPRPLSPPLQRISKSTSAPLEYGLPSTHSTNAISVIIYAIYHLRSDSSLNGASLLLLELIFYAYAITLIFGRWYCGMHGFLDVFVGSLIGAILGVLQCLYGDVFDDWIFYGPLSNLILASLMVLVLVRIHPEPADDCPCFDDSVSFAGVFIGIQASSWHFTRSGFAWNDPAPSTTPFDFASLGLIKTMLRIALGVAVILAWRGFAKPFCLRFLPPVFRIFETLGLSIPRKFFLKASEYKIIPPLMKDDNVIPPASEIPGMLNPLRHHRKRSISVGPQSVADAYETMHIRERNRKESQLTPELQSSTAEVSAKAFQNYSREEEAVSSLAPEIEVTLEQPEQDKKDDQAMFQQLLKPRVRYDVEVVTRLIVYAGIGWLAIEGCPILFEFCGLGMGVHW